MRFKQHHSSTTTSQLPLLNHRYYYSHYYNVFQRLFPNSAKVRYPRAYHVYLPPELTCFQQNHWPIPLHQGHPCRDSWQPYGGDLLATVWPRRARCRRGRVQRGPCQGLCRRCCRPRDRQEGCRSRRPHQRSPAGNQWYASPRSLSILTSCMNTTGNVQQDKGRLQQEANK